MILAGAGGFGSESLTWKKLVDLLVLGFNSVIEYAQNLLVLFITPFRDLITDNFSTANWFEELLVFLNSLLAFDFLSMTPLELMLGFAVPFVIVFAVYRYFKR